MATKWVYMFTEGNATMRNLLGGKGANLAEMTSLGLPVPQGLTVPNAVPGLSPGLSHLACHAVYAPFTPSKSG